MCNMKKTDYHFCNTIFYLSFSFKYVYVTVCFNFSDGAYQPVNIQIAKLPDDSGP